MGLLSRRKTEQERQEDVDRAVSRKQVLLFAKELRNEAQRLMAAAGKTESNAQKIIETLDGPNA